MGAEGRSEGAAILSSREDVFGSYSESVFVSEFERRLSIVGRSRSGRSTASCISWSVVDGSASVRAVSGPGLRCWSPPSPWSTLGFELNDRTSAAYVVRTLGVVWAVTLAAYAVALTLLRNPPRAGLATAAVAIGVLSFGYVAGPAPIHLETPGATSS